MPDLHDLLAAEAVRQQPNRTPAFDDLRARRRRRDVARRGGAAVFAAAAVTGALVILMPTVGREEPTTLVLRGSPSAASPSTGRPVLTGEAAFEIMSARTPEAALDKARELGFHPWLLDANIGASPNPAGPDDDIALVLFHEYLIQVRAVQVPDGGNGTRKVTAADAEALLGMTSAEATRAALNGRYVLKVEVVDGTSFASSADRRFDRIGIHLTAGRVSAASAS